MQTVDEITKILKSDIRPKADKLLKVHEKEKKELADQISGLDSAIKDKQKRLIKMHTKELESEVKQLALRLNHSAKLLSRLDGLDPEDGFGPRDGRN